MNSKIINPIKIDNRLIGKININDLLLFDIIIPNEQRIKDDTKIEEIIEYQENFNKKNGHFNFLGVINIHQLNEHYYLVDGQHRFNALKKMNNKGYESINIIIELIKIDSLDCLKHNYQLINKNTPLPEFPDTINKLIIMF